MSWLTQKTGEINHHNPSLDKGTQPIRVLHYMNLFKFQNSNPGFSKELVEAFDKYGFSKTIGIIYGNHPIRTPYIKAYNKQIILQETFLSYLWCVIFHLYSFYIFKIDFPRCNILAGYEKYKVDSEDIEKSKKLFQYAKSLKVVFSKWDKDYLPNPEKYKAEKRNLIEQTNMFYTEAVKFILAHEFIHATKHINKDVQMERLEMEIEADYKAIEILKKGIIKRTGYSEITKRGIVFGILSLLFIKRDTEFITHPNTEDRLINALLQLKVEEYDIIWDFSIIALKLWDEQFIHNFKWDNQKSSRNQFFSIIKQIKERQEK